MADQVEPKETLKDVVSLRRISQIAKEIISMDELASHLGVTPAELTEIDHDKRTYLEKKMEMLRRWKVKNAYRATYERLIKAAEGSDDTELANKIEKLILGTIE